MRMNSKQRAVLNQIQELKLKKPTDLIVNQITQMVSSGVLKPGDRLPAERAFSERFGVGRGHIREALKRLEVFGILKTMPQSGTYVANLGANALKTLMANVLAVEIHDMDSLMETRRILEVNAARLAAERATTSDIIDLIKTHEGFRKRLRNDALEWAEDRIFHLKVADCSKNRVLRSLIALLATNTDITGHEGKGVGEEMENTIFQEHEVVLQAIKQKDPDQAAEAMETHMDTILAVQTVTGVNDCV